MFDDKRKMTSIVYLTSLGTSISVCFIPMPAGAKIGILVLCECKPTLAFVAKFTCEDVRYSIDFTSSTFQC